MTVTTRRCGGTHPAFQMSYRANIEKIGAALPAICAVATEQSVVAVATNDPVVTGTTAHHVVIGTGHDHIVAAKPTITSPPSVPVNSSLPSVPMIVATARHTRTQRLRTPARTRPAPLLRRSGTNGASQPPEGRRTGIIAPPADKGRGRRVLSRSRPRP